MFEKTLTDLIRGLRSSAKTHTEQDFISKCLREIQTEIKSDDLALKAEAVAKLSYLHMLGFDMSWAAFHVVELMACSDLQKKRIGYLCATFVFNMPNPVLMLTTNLIKKDLSSNMYAESCIALHSLAQIVSHDLARDLTVELIGMLKHSSPGIRKRSILVLFRMFVHYPESLQQAFPLLKDKLDDPDPTVVSTAVNVIVELGTRHPKSYLFLAPKFFQLLKSSTSVWIRLKIVKLFVSFTLIEPRLIRKLADILSDIIQNTNALSLLHVCIRTVILGGFIGTKESQVENSTEFLLELICKKLKMLLSVEDVNLNVLGLATLKDLLDIRPEIASLFTDSIIRSLENGELSVSSSALGLIPRMVIHENFLDLTQKLMAHVLLSRDELGSSSVEESNDYRTNAACCILEIIAKDTFEYVEDFEWIIEILIELSKVSGLALGHKLSDLMIDITLRVPEIREYAITQLLKLLDQETKDIFNLEIFVAAGFIIGEYPQFVPTSMNAFLILTNENLANLTCEIQGVFIQSSFKLFSFWIGAIQSEIDFKSICKLYTDHLRNFCGSEYLEVQQRASQFIFILRELSERASKMSSWKEALLFLHYNARFIFQEELNPILPHAQNLVLKPSEIDIDKWIYEDFSIDLKLEDYFSDDEEPDEILESTIEPHNAKFQNDVYYISGASENIVDDIPLMKLSLQSGDMKSPKDMHLEELETSKKPKKYIIKKKVDLPEGISLEHAISSKEQDKFESKSRSQEPPAFSLSSPKLQPFIREPSQERSSPPKKERQKHKRKNDQVAKIDE